jgi:transposase
VLRFLTGTQIPPASNQAGRDLRPAKTQEKIPGRIRSKESARHRYAIPGYISTAAKHHADILTTLRDALCGNPWMPPIPPASDRPPSKAPASNRDLNAYPGITPKRT